MSLCFLSICLSSRFRLIVYRQQGKLAEKVDPHFPDLLAYPQPAQSWVHSGCLINTGAKEGIKGKMDLRGNFSTLYRRLSLNGFERMNEF